MFTKFFSKTETYLLAFPLLLAGIVNNFSPDGNVRIYVNEDYVTMPVYECLVLAYLMLAVPLVLHFCLKNITQKYSVAAIAHTACSCILLVCAATIVLQSPVWVAKWRPSVLPAPVNDAFRSNQNILLLLAGAFVLVQVMFALYGLEKLFTSMNKTRTKIVLHEVA